MTGTRDWKAELAIIRASAAGREALIVDSFARVTGGALLPAGSDPIAALWNLPTVVVAHGTEADPLFFYGNRAALTLFEMRAEEFVRFPSRLSAEAPEREARAKLMERVKRANFVDNYSGVRVSATGKRFWIDAACVWNMLGEDGGVRGQAAAFAGWTPLD